MLTGELKLSLINLTIKIEVNTHKNYFIVFANLLAI